MSIGNGIDIIEVKRIQECIEKHGENFLNRVFTEKEIEYCEGKNVQKFQSYAGRFAVKEAVFKAISKRIENKFCVEWKDIEVVNDENGRPCVNLYGKINKENLHISSVDVSISHIKEVAIASAMVQFGTSM